MTAADTRDRILDALERLLAGAGPAQISLEAVAAAAGVSKGGLLHHFRSKEAMLAAMVRRLGERADGQLAEAVAGGTTIAEFYLQSFDEADQENLALLRSAIAALRSADGQSTEVQQAVTEVMRSWDDGLRREIPDPVRAEIVRLVGDGLYLAALLGLPQPEPALHREVVRALLGGPGDAASTTARP